MGANKQYILFDLDGTLTDSKTGILKSVQYAMKSFGVEIKDEDLDSYSFFVGPPLRDSFKSRFGLDGEKAEKAVGKFREYLIAKGLYENEVYPGIENLLRGLKNADKTIILATSKAGPQAVAVLKHFDLIKYFDFIAGAEPDGRRSDKAEVILYALGHFGIVSASDEEKTKAVMIGDRNHDIIGAGIAGIESVGVLWGYGSREELTSGEYKADYIVKDTGELLELLGQL